MVRENPIFITAQHIITDHWTPGKKVEGEEGTNKCLLRQRTPDIKYMTPENH
jgi:hypothetical protein